ncbi:MAG: phosphotransferase [Cyanobacteria bacterium J06628_6]
MTASKPVDERLPSRSLASLMQIADQFNTGGRVQTIKPLGSGNINDTFQVLLDNSPAPYFVLQRLNTQVFQQPHQVMHNICCFTEHVQRRLDRLTLQAGRRWVVPRVIRTHQGHDHWLNAQGEFWRGISFVPNAVTFDTIQSAQHAQEVGYGLGMFHHLISDLPPTHLTDTLSGFHVTPQYLQQYQEILTQSSTTECPEVLLCTRYIQSWASRVTILEAAKARGDLSLRLMHGDPKVNNILLDADTHQAVSLIDLDTVKPGLIHYDIGDCLRSGCNRLGEESPNWESVTFDVDICEIILKGYYSAAKRFLTTADMEYLYDAIWLIAFELGLRFFTDYLAGNIYFKASHAEHNLMRALVQFKLVESIESQADTLSSMIQSLG